MTRRTSKRRTSARRSSRSLQHVVNSDTLSRLVHGMGVDVPRVYSFGCNDARIALRAWFAGEHITKGPSYEFLEKQRSASDFLASPTGKKLVNQLVAEVGDALKHSDHPVGFRTVAKAVDDFMSPDGAGADARVKQPATVGFEEDLGRRRSSKRLRRNGPGRYLLVRDLPRSLQAALREVEYGKKDIEVKARETFDPSAAGGGGRRGFVAACKMDDSGTYEIEWGSWGGENPFTKTVEGFRGEVPISPEIAFIRGSIGGGIPTMASVYVSPHAMNPALLTAGPEVTPKEAKILAIFKGLKSSYRPEYLDRLQEKEGIESSRERKATTDREIESLIERGFLSRNKAGSISITTEGRNAADPRQP